MGSSASDDFSVVVVASDLGIDARSLLSESERAQAHQDQEEEDWHDCASDLLNEDFSDLEALEILRVEGVDKAGNRILRIVGKYFPAPVMSGERLKKYVFHKLFTELSEGPFCVVYMHSTVQKEDNNPGITILRWIYEELPSQFKDRLQVVYFVHPGLRSRLLFATLGRLFLSGGVYWKIKYVSRLQYLWEDIKKGEVEIPEFVQNHDEVLEHRPLTDYGIEPDPLHMTEMPSMGYAFGRNDERWAARELQKGMVMFLLMDKLNAALISQLGRASELQGLPDAESKCPPYGNCKTAPQGSLSDLCKPLKVVVEK